MGTEYETDLGTENTGVGEMACNKRGARVPRIWYNCYEKKMLYRKQVSESLVRMMGPYKTSTQ